MQYVQGEIVKPIQGFEKYIISEYGRVYRVVKSAKHLNKILLPNSNVKIFCEIKRVYVITPPDNEYYSIPLWDNNNKLTSRALHRLVYETFGHKLDGTHHTYKFDFIDGNCKNLHIDNIHVSLKVNYGKKITPQIEQRITELHEKGMNVSKVSLIVGVPVDIVKRILIGTFRGKIKDKELGEFPVRVKDESILELLKAFKFEKINGENISRKFALRFNPKDLLDITVVGRIEGSKFKKRYKDVALAKKDAKLLNDYFKL